MAGLSQLDVYKLMSLRQASLHIFAAMQDGGVVALVPEEAGKLADCEVSLLMLVDKQRNELIPCAWQGLEIVNRELMGVHMGKGMLGRVALLRRPEACYYPNMDLFLHYLMQPEELKAALAVPITYGQEVVGVLTVGSHLCRAFDFATSWILGELAKDIGIALKFCDLLDLFKQRSRQVSSLVELYEVMGSLGLEGQVEQGLGKICEIMDVEMAGYVAARDSQGLDPSSWTFFPVDVLPRGTFASLLPLAEEVFRIGKPMVCNRFHPSYWNGEDRFIRVHELRNLLLLPLEFDQRRTGVFYLGNKREGRFCRDDLSLAQLFARHLAILVENRRLYQEQKRQSNLMYELKQAVEQQNEKLKRVLAVHDELIQHVLRGDEIDDITRSISNLVGNPVIVRDRFLKIVSCTDTTFLFNDALTGEQVRRYFQETEANRRPVYISSKEVPGIGKPLLIAPITTGGNTLGFISVIDACHPLGELEAMIVEQGSTVLALKMVQQRVALEVEQRLKGDFIEDLLAGAISDPEQVYRQAMLLGLNLEVPHQIILVSVEGRPVADFDFRGRLIEYIHKAIGQRLPDSLIVGKGELVVILIPAAYSKGSTHQGTARQLGEKIMVALTKAFPDIYPIVIIGRPCQKLMDYQSSYHEARKLVEISRSASYAGRVITYEDLKVERLLLEMADKAYAGNFIDEILGALIEYDKKHNSHLVETLTVYLRNDCRLDLAARELFVHKNTLKYRLQRIREITGLDIQDAEVRFKLLLALRMYSLGGYRGQGQTGIRSSSMP
ncbi:MAG: GAF domain-containing protein [Clostridia bacterium]|nr:MAG: GAF domain-containing protein [Clostridia bacterium]